MLKTLGNGGFGITYLAYQPLLDRKVCIKEFFYKDYCERNQTTSQVTMGTQNNQDIVLRFLEKFIKEAKTISKQKHPNIISIFDEFSENNTAYYVMEYIEGESLFDKVKREGALQEHDAVNYIRQVADALSYVHAKNINHLDVKPANIMIRQSDNSALLIDFGLSKQYDVVGSQTSSTPVGISEGFAPLEQYQAGGVNTFSPQADIYSLGATLYYLVTGKIPPSASEIVNNGLPALPSNISSKTSSAIYKAMQFRKKDRPESIASFLDILDNPNDVPFSADASVNQVSINTLYDNVAEETKVIGKKDEVNQLGEDEVTNRSIKNHIGLWLLVIIVVVIGYFIVDRCSFSSSKAIEQPVYEAPIVETQTIQEEDNSDAQIESSIRDAISSIYKEVEIAEYRYQADDDFSYLEKLNGKYCSKEFNRLLKEADRLTEEGELGPIDYDYWVGGNGGIDHFYFDIKEIVVHSKTSANVSISVRNMSSAARIKLVMIKEGSDWKIDDFTPLKREIQEFIREKR